MFGVGMSRQPWKPTSAYPMSSASRITMFGVGAASRGAAAATRRTKPPLAIFKIRAMFMNPSACRFVRAHDHTEIQHAAERVEGDEAREQKSSLVGRAANSIARPIRGPAAARGATAEPYSVQQCAFGLMGS